MQDYTVIATIAGSGQLVAHHVEATGPFHAFTVAAELDDELEFVCCLPGTHMEHDTLFFPGESVVDADTVLDQPEVFND